MQALASLPGVHFTALEISDRDAFAALRTDRRPADSYTRMTLFPSRPIREVSLRELRSALWQALDRLRPDVLCVNGWGLPGSRTTLRWTMARRVPAVIMSDSTATDFRRVAWKEFVKTRLLRHFSSAVVAGTRHREYLVSLGFPAEQIFGAYDVVDNGHFERGANEARADAARTRLRLRLPDKYFLACGRFSPKKNSLGLIEAYDIFRQQNHESEWKLVLVGDGELRKEAEMLARQLGLGGEILFAGEQGYDVLPAFYGLASMFVHPSTSEQWGLVVNEAMAAGLPVLVSSACGCAADLVRQGENGFTFSPADRRGLAQLLSRMTAADLSLERFGRRSSEIIANWTPNDFARSVRAAAESAVRVPKSAPSALDSLLFMSC